MSESGRELIVERELQDKNFNMISCVVHLGGDCLRNVTNLIAAILSSIIVTISSDVYDAWAVIVSSGIIIVLVVVIVWDISLRYERMKETNEELNDIFNEAVGMDGIDSYDTSDPCMKLLSKSS